MKRIVFNWFFLLTVIMGNAQHIDVYPTHWWVHMKWNKVQLLVHETDPGYILAVEKLTVRSSSPDIKIKEIHKVKNKRYLLFDIEIAPNAKPQVATISFGGIVPSEQRSFQFELKARRQGNGTAYANGATAADLMYLIMPDRFSNGDPTNDRIAGMRDQS